MSEEYNNVILLSIDALRKDRINGEYERNVAPFLSKLAEENTEFTNCISTSSHTREAMSSVLTGVYPYKANKKGLMPENAPGSGFHLDAEIISSYLDIQKGGFHSNPFLSRSFGYGKDWDKLDDGLYLGNSKILTLLNRFFDKLLNRHYSRAEKINEKSLRWIDSHQENFFLWNHYMDPHGPYQPPKNFRGKYQENPVSDREAQKLLKKAINKPEEISEDEQQTLIDLYDEEISYVDSEIENFFEELEERDILEDILIMIVGDHGEAFGQNGFYEHGEALNEELVRVPLIMVDGQNGTIKPSTSVIDIVPTILSVLSKNPGNNIDGENLMDIADEPEKFEDRIVFSQDTKDHHMLFGGFNGDNFFLFEAENRNFEDESSSNLEKEVKKYAKRALDREDVSGSKEEVEEEVKERLEALGYMEEKSR